YNMRITKRIVLDESNVTRSVKQPENNDETGENEISGEIANGCVEFRLNGCDLEGFAPQHAAAVIDDNGNAHPAMGGWPETEISFSFTEEDLPRVQAWFDDDYHNVSVPESAPLQKNRKTAVLNALKSYFSAAKAANLFTSPFRLAWRYLLHDGSVSNLHDAGIFATSMSAPLLPITSASISGKNLYTRAQLRNVPAHLELRLKDDVDIEGLKSKIAAIEIFVTEPVLLYDADAEVAGIRSVTVDGSPHRCWHYDRYDAEALLLRVQQLSDFRKISTISTDEIDNFSDFNAIPISAGALSGFSKLPKPDTGSMPDPIIPAGCIVTLATRPLHLGLPDTDKSLRSVAIRGVFPRGQICFRVYGSQHREQWHLIADVRGPFVSGMHGVRWRWYRFEIEYRHRNGDFVEAIALGVRH
ncbi:MAG: hypothetical protein K2K97_07240, partial [Muribaculaceae bacterium]|nr:hypothetical protein [Muribaculaceae bacterium]